MVRLHSKHLDDKKFTPCNAGLFCPTLTVALFIQSASLLAFAIVQVVLWMPQCIFWHSLLQYCILRQGQHFNVTLGPGPLQTPVNKVHNVLAQQCESSCFFPNNSSGQAASGSIGPRAWGGGGQGWWWAGLGAGLGDGCGCRVGQGWGAWWWGGGQGWAGARWWWQGVCEGQVAGVGGGDGGRPLSCGACAAVVTGTASSEKSIVNIN